MTVDEFAELTLKVIAAEGFEDYAPTACFPERECIAVMQGVPADEDVESFCVPWALNSLERPDEEVLVAFKTDAKHFKVVRHRGKESDSSVFDVCEV